MSRVLQRTNVRASSGRAEFPYSGSDRKQFILDIF